jgi:hypothetical protein
MQLREAYRREEPPATTTIKTGFWNAYKIIPVICQPEFYLSAGVLFVSRSFICQPEFYLSAGVLFVSRSFICQPKFYTDLFVAPTIFTNFAVVTAIADRRRQRRLDSTNTGLK